MQVIISVLISTLAVIVSAYIIPGVVVESFTTAIVVAIVLGIINMFVKPILVLLTLPITVLTLGIFLLVINAVIIILVTNIVPGFRVNGFIAALLFSLVLSIVSSFLHSL